MKKIILFLLLFLCVGCGKKLTCTYTEEYEDIKIKNKIVFNFKTKTYKETNMMVFKDSSEANDYFNDIRDYIEEYNLTISDNKIISDIKGEISDDKKTLKERYEGYEYSCK